MRGLWCPPLSTTRTLPGVQFRRPPVAHCVGPRIGAYRPPHPVFADQCPLAIAVVELEEGPRMISNVIGCDPNDVTIGMAVRVDFEQIDDSNVALPVFTPVTP